MYNEVIRDLLNPSAGILELMEDDKGNVRVPGLSSVRAPNMNRVSQKVHLYHIFALPYTAG